MAFLRSLQNSAFTNWFLGSDSIWTYPTVLTLHTVGMAMLVGASVVVALRLLNVGTGVPLARLLPLYRIIWTGFGINLGSGLVLFITEAADRATDPVFFIKLASIGAALWVGILMKRRLRATEDVASGANFGRGMAAASLSLWTVAIVAGRLMAYLKK